MDEPTFAGREDNRIFQQVIAHFDAPAYVRRGRGVQEALDALIASCRRQRDEWLTMAVIRLGTLRGLAGEWDCLSPSLADAAQLEVLEQLWAELKPTLLVRIAPTTAKKKLRQALEALIADLNAFNQRWAAYLPTVDFTEVNRRRDGYNRYYVLEKECAVRSHVVARQGFRPLPPLTVKELGELLPPLPVPRMGEG